MYLEKALVPLILLVISVWVYWILKKHSKTESFAECKPECCINSNSQLSCDRGCVCLNAKEQAALETRGGNSNAFSQF